MNPTLEQFISKLVETLKEYNKTNYCYEATKQPIDIPFIISTLSQSFTNNEETYKEFISDLERWGHFGDDCYFSGTGYYLEVNNPSDRYNGIIDISVYSLSDEHKYQLCFSYEERNYGYCECTPDMPDYREDKKCCGHGCDADFCEFTLNKVTEITSAKWQGDEHDYWEFEDEFYRKNNELLKNKKKQDEEFKFRELKNRIESSLDELEKLMRDK